jgi:hypothetical protein
MFFLEFFESILSSFHFILVATSLSFLLKMGILIALIRKTINMGTVARPLFFLFAILVGNMFSDLAWMLKLSQLLFSPKLVIKLFYLSFVLHGYFFLFNISLCRFLQKAW